VDRLLTATINKVATKIDQSNEASHRTYEQQTSTDRYLNQKYSSLSNCFVSNVQVNHLSFISI